MTDSKGEVSRLSAVGFAVFCQQKFTLNQPIDVQA